MKRPHREKMKTEVVEVDNHNPDEETLRKAVGIIEHGGLVAFPTETVYGLGADYLNKKAVQKLYKVKKRPENKPFTIHVSDFDELVKLSCEISPFSKNLIEDFWPGPLTLILRTRSGEKLGIRMPRNKIALEFISMCKTPIVAPSANISGHRPPRRAEDVLKDLDGKIDMLLDGGETDMGVESTVVDMTISPYKILREGAIHKGRIADIIYRRLQHIYV